MLPGPMTTIEKGHGLSEGTLLTRWQGYQKKREQESQKIHQSDRNAKGKQSPFFKSISLPWREKAGLCMGRLQGLRAAHGSGRDEMLSAAMAGYPSTRAGAVGRRSCLPRPARSRPQSARRLLRQPLKRKTTFRNGGLFLNAAELANVGAAC